MPYATRKGPEQAAYPRRLIRAFFCYSIYFRICIVYTESVNGRRMPVTDWANVCWFGSSVSSYAIKTVSHVCHIYYGTQKLIK